MSAGETAAVKGEGATASGVSETTRFPPNVHRSLTPLECFSCVEQPADVWCISIDEEAADLLAAGRLLPAHRDRLAAVDALCQRCADEIAREDAEVVGGNAGYWDVQTVPIAIDWAGA